MQSLKSNLLFLLLLIHCVVLRAETRHIHVIKMLDDNSSNYIVSEGARSIDYGIDRQVQQIQQQLGITTVYEHRITGTDFNRDKLEEVLEYELSYQERDIIIMVYTGHGYRDPGSQSRFPKLYFNNYANGLEIDDLRLSLLQKNPSLLINFVIACNVTQYDLSKPPLLPSDGNMPPVAALAPMAKHPIDNNYNWKHLFSDAMGYTKVVDLFSADKENFTFIARDGGIFFNEVLYTFQEVFQGRRFKSWNEVCNNIATRTTIRSQERQLAQQPYCNFEIYFSTTVEVEDRVLSKSACKRIARSMRKKQRKELKQLRRTHRIELRSLNKTADYRAKKQLIVARQRQEKAELRHIHLQNYHRSLMGCR